MAASFDWAVLPRNMEGIFRPDDLQLNHPHMQFGYRHATMSYRMLPVSR